MSARLRDFISITKPGIIIGNLITAASGFFLASRPDFLLEPFLWMLLGLASVIASASIFNNYLDRDIDAKMQRTMHRALVEKRIRLTHALLLGGFLGLAGIYVLKVHVALFSTIAALLAFIVYVGFYTLFTKRQTIFGTFVGAISGALPPVVGYLALGAPISATALLLFAILFFWQIPHFYAIGIYRAHEYAAAGIRILPVVATPRATKIVILLAVAGFSAAAIGLEFVAHLGRTYLVAAILISVAWLFVGIEGFRAHDNILWARRLFVLSLVHLLVLFGVMSLAALSLLP